MRVLLLWLVLVVFWLGSAEASCPAGDLNGDCEVDMEDLQALSEQWLAPPESPADLNGDDWVNITDLALLVEQWGQTGIPLAINELMASNSSCIKDQQNEYDDWIEIYNYSIGAIDTSGMYLTDDPGRPRMWRIPSNNPAATTIPAGGYLLIWADNDTTDAGLHANFKLDADGEQVALFDSDGVTLVDSVSFPKQVADISYGRYPDANDNRRFFASPSPSAQNNDAYFGVVADTQLSHRRGFYDATFSVTIATDTEDAVIYYTLDGSNPVDANGLAYDSNHPIQITTTTCLRAVAHKPGWLSSNVDTQTYIFLSDAINQPSTAPGPDWPPPGSWYGQTIDYEMDPAVTKSPEYKDLIKDALLSTPSICLSTDLDNLFDPDTGIYVNCGHYNDDGWERGKAWERPASVELINPDGSEGFQINAGLRMRGITSCGGWNPKHVFRLFFRAKYDGDLEYPLFGDEGTDTFGNIDLRCEQNYSWNMDGDSRNTFIREVFCRDLQGEMRQPSSKSRYYHLYLNGVYWGLYQSQERPNSNYAMSYFGGDNDDYDTVKTNRSWPRSVECTDGTFAAYKRLWQHCLDGFETDQKYYQVQGMNTDGSVNPAYEKLVDIDNLIDYMLTIYYTGDFDAPISGWHSNNMPNNFFGLYNRVSPDGFKFFRHDGEHTMMSVNENRTGPYTASSLMSFTEGYFVEPWPPQIYIGFNPQTIHQHLIVHPEYKMRFADRVHRHFFNNGPMTVEGAQQLFASRAAQIDMAIIAESARWGDAKADPPRTRNHWLSAIAWVLDSYMPTRTSTVINQFRNKGWYPNLDAPEYKVNGSFQHGGQALAGDILTMTNPDGLGTVYYTLDGHDPRLPQTQRGVAGSTSIVGEGADKRVLVPAGAISDDWRGGAAFSDLSWTSGSSGVGYERSSGYESLIEIDILDQMYNRNATCYIRIPFAVNAADLAGFNFMTLKIRYDDGFVAYLNGLEVARRNFTDTPIWNSHADGNHDDSAAVTLEDIDVTAFLSALEQGDNILAIHGLNASTTSSDFLISVKLVAGQSIPPGGGGVSPTAVEYTGPINLSETTHVKARVLDGNTWSALGEAVFAIGPVAENLRITEIMYHPQGTVEPNDPNEEFIELTNIGTETINLNLVSFTNGIDFTFPSLNLAAGEHIVVVQDKDAFKARYGTTVNVAGQYTGRLGNAGERIRLEDAIGRTILDFSYKDGWRSITDDEGFSLTIIDPANPNPNSWGQKDSWRPSAYTGGSPGQDDSGILPNPGAIVINEVLAHSHDVAADWIEFYNTTADTIDIGGWFISDSNTNLAKYEFAAGTKMGPYKYVVLTENLHFGNKNASGCHEPFALSENGEQVYLSSVEDGVLTGYRNVEDFGASATGVSFGRYHKPSTYNYNFVPMQYNTRGYANADPQVGPIVISEIMYNPDWPEGGSYTNDQYEYIELYNITAAPAKLYDDLTDEPWKLTDGVEFTFPDDPAVTIPAGGYLLVVKNVEAFTWRYPSVPAEKILGPYDGKLNNGGERVELGMPGDVDKYGVRQYIRVDRVDYSDGSHPQDCPGGVDLWPTGPDGGGKSLTRKVSTDYGNDHANWITSTPSPGE